MPWGNKNAEVPEELKDLGLTPAQIREAVLNNKKLTEDLASSKTELSTVKTTLSTMEGSFGETKRKLDELEANTRRRSTNEDRTEKTYTSFIDDENKAFAERAADAMQPVALAALRSGARAAKIEAKMGLQGQFVETPGGRISLSRLWDKWSAEIDKAAESTSLDVLGNSATWINIFDYVKGKHFNELMKEPQTFVESVSTNTDRSLNEEKKDDKLNTEEEATIKKMSRYGKGVTPDSYKKTKEGMKFVTV